MSAHGPYVLQDGPTKKFWKDFDGPALGAQTGEWVIPLSIATQYSTKSDAEFARSNRRIGMGRAAMSRLHIVQVADVPAPKSSRPPGTPAQTTATA